MKFQAFIFEIFFDLQCFFLSCIYNNCFFLLGTIFLYYSFIKNKKYYQKIIIVFFKYFQKEIKNITIFENLIYISSFFFLLLLLSNYLSLFNNNITLFNKTMVPLSLTLIIYFLSFYFFYSMMDTWIIYYFYPENVNFWIVLFLLPLEIFLYCIKPLSIAFRLISNLLAGHILLINIILVGLFLNYNNFFVVFWIILLLIFLLEIFVLCLQTYVYTYLLYSNISEYVKLYSITSRWLDRILINGLYWPRGVLMQKDTKPLAIFDDRYVW